MVKVKICHERSKLVVFSSPQKNQLMGIKPFSERISAFYSGQKTQKNNPEILGMKYFGHEKIPNFGQNHSHRLKSPENTTFKGFFKFPKAFPISSDFLAIMKQFDGAQKGIEVFKGLDIIKTFIATTNICSIPTMRGCRNACSHCYLDAKPPIRNTDTHISSPLWEDFVDLVCGISEFNKRTSLPFSIFSQERSISPFWDSDPIATKMPDLKGGFHGITEAVDLLYTKLRKPLLIDTAGWAIQDKWAQTQAEELARYIKENPDAIYYKRVSISTNPFSPLMKKCFALENQGNIEGAEKMEEKYVDRMANVFLTFLECKPNPFSKAHIDGQYSQQTQYELNHKICDRIWEKAEKNGIIDSAIFELGNLDTSLQNGYAELIAPEGRGAKFFTLYEVLNHLGALRKEAQEQRVPDRILKAPKLFDINGKVYLVRDYEQIDTGIQLNFRNKHKKTAPFNNYIHQNYVSKAV